METQSYSSRKVVWYAIATVFLVLLVDQALKFYIKTNFQIGDTRVIFDDWFHLHFVENSGMAFGLEFSKGGKWAKIALSVFRLVASVFILFYIRSLIKEKAKPALIILISLILAGALGNIIDSVLYGMLFTSSNHQVAEFLSQDGGYAPIMMGKVVDMFYFPLIDTFWPDWVPYFGGSRFEFFRPVFNVADSAISIGVFAILLFRKRLFVGTQIRV